MKYISIIFMLTSFIAYSQKGTFTIGGGSSLMVSGYWSHDNMEFVSGCCFNPDFDRPTHFNYEPNYQKKFLMYSNSDLDLIPTIEVKYYLFDRLKLIGNIFGIKRRLKFNASRYYGPDSQYYRLSYHDETIRLGASFGASYELLNASDKHLIYLGLLNTFDRVFHREIIENFGTFSMSYPQKDFDATEIFPPYTGTNYLLFALLDYEFKFTKNWSVMTRFRYNPKLDFTRNYKQGSYKGTRPIHRAILGFDLQVVYRFGGN
ncbi:MAG: hypothetical protein WEA99_05025 [Brumimicrobium sp.]